MQLSDDPGISYDGGLAGYAATAPAPGQRYNANAGHVQSYTTHLRQKQDAKLASIGASGRKIYSYAHSDERFRRKSDRRRKQLCFAATRSVAAVWEDYAFELDTNNSPDFLGLNNRRDGLHRRQWLKGEDVIVGILDSGITTNHPSFAETRTFPLPRFCDHPDSRILRKICRYLERHQTRVVYDDPPAHWAGECEIGEAFSEAECNNKLIGARWYVDGFIAGRGSVVEDEFLSPRDSSGHGTHTASTAAGNEVVASLNGTELDKIKGMAPRARRCLQGLLVVAGRDELQLLLL